jgi:rare lipoprotein A
VAPIVTWYGPGFYGQRTACGERYTRFIVGVAHKTLPCGTLIQFRWHGMTATAPVIDRGPYASAAYVFDFSAALACRIFRPRGVQNSCFTRYDVQWRVVGRRR